MTKKVASILDGERKGSCDGIKRVSLKLMFLVGFTDIYGGLTQACASSA